MLVLTLGYFLTYMMMGTLRTSTSVRLLAVVLPALLAGVMEFCLFCLVCGLCCCSSFWSVCFICLSLCCVVFLLFFLLFMTSGERGRDPVPFRCCRWSLSLLHCVFSLRSTSKLTTSTINTAAAVLKVCC